MQLRKSIEYDGKTITALTFRAHTIARDYEAFDRAGGGAQSLALIAGIAGIPEAVLERAMHGADYRAAKAHCDAMVDADEASIKAHLAALKEAGESILDEPDKRLRDPLEFGKKTFKELRFRDHTLAGDYLAFDTRGGTAQRIALVAGIAGVDEEIVKRLHGPDYQIAMAYVDALIERDEAALFPREEAENVEKK